MARQFGLVRLLVDHVQQLRFCSVVEQGGAVAGDELPRRLPGLGHQPFDEQIAQSPGVFFGGAYRPAELSELYGGVHFNWAIDYFEEGANSALLLPNRIYEGGLHGAVPIALARTETGRWLKQRGIGTLFDSPGNELGCFLEHLTSSAYARLRQAVRSQPRRGFVADLTDCESLVSALALAARGEAAPDRVTSDVDVRPAGSINTV